MDNTNPIMIKATTLFTILDLALAMECFRCSEETGRKIIDLSAIERWWLVFELYRLASEGIMKIQKHMLDVETRIPYFQPRLKTKILIIADNLKQNKTKYIKIL